MGALKKPRIWLWLWGAFGAAGLLYVIISASVSPDERALSAIDHSRALLTGEMEDFQYASIPRNAPESSFEHEGRTVALADFRGKAILVNFWATWCAPCVKELPSLDALQARLGDDAFEVVAIAAEPRAAETAKDFLDRHGIKNLQFYADPTLALTTAVGADVLPVSILYDAEGREIGRLVGEADWISPEAERLVASAKP